MRARSAPPSRTCAFLGLLLAVLSPFALAEPAGRIIFAAGGVVAIDSSGSMRPLEKAGTIHEGDTLLTNDGRVQILFKDGGFVALQPDTEFTVERYRYSVAGDSEDSAIMSLLKGGLRTISGLVGKRNRRGYSMKTSVATIGIRGTDYALQLSDKLLGSVAEGGIEVCNRTGCVTVLAGQGVLVPSPTDMPVLSERRVLLPPPEPRATRPSGSKDAAGRNDRSPLAAAGGPPGQARHSHAGDVRVALPPPVAPAAPPGQLNELDAGLFGAVGHVQGKGLGPPGGIPPGQR